jgi:hypothetical protein
VQGSGGLFVTGGPTTTQEIVVSPGFGISTESGGVNVNGTLLVNLATNLRGATTVNNVLTVTGATFLTGAAQANAGLLVTNGSFGVGPGASSFAGPVTMANTLAVAGQTTLGTLVATGATTLAGVGLTGSLSVAGNASVGGALSASTLTAVGAIAGASVTANGTVLGATGSFANLLGGTVGVSTSVTVAGGGAITVGAGGTITAPTITAPTLVASNSLFTANATLQGTTIFPAGSYLAMRGLSDAQTWFSAMATRSNSVAIPSENWTDVPLEGFSFNPLGSAGSPGYSINGNSYLVVAGIPIFDVFCRVRFDNDQPNASSGKIRAIRLRRSDDGGVSFSTFSQTTAPVFEDDKQIVEINTTIYNADANPTIVLRLQAYQDTNGPAVDVDLTAVDGYSAVVYVKAIYCPSPIPNNP